MSDDEAEPLGGLADEVRSRTGDRPDDDPSRRKGPLSDVAAEVDERRRRRRESDAADPFESVDVGDLDGEKLWERLAEDNDGTAVEAPPADAEAVEGLAGRDVRTVPKGTCHGCPHFGDPPELACTLEGTDIVGMPDVDHFRVADCPMVVEEEELGVIDGDGSGDDGPRDDDAA